MKKGVLFIFGIFIILITLNQILALSVGNSIPIQIQTTDTPGNIITGTFNFTINISNSSTCSPVLYSNTTTKTTDARGIVSYNLENISLEFDEQYWFCYYRDSILKQTTKIARTPYAFRAKNVTLSGVEIDSNFDLGSYNFTTLGRVGIGTTSPNEKLHIMDNVDTKLKIESTLAGTQGATALTLYNNVSDTPYYWNIQSLGSDGRFRIYDAAGASQGGRFTIDQSGLVGIGTATPDQELHVKDSTSVVGATQIYAEGGKGGYGAGISFMAERSDSPYTLTTQAKIVADGVSAWNADAATDSELSFWTVENNNLTEKMVIRHDGKVGIGTTSPANEFHVNDDDGNAYIRVGDSVYGVRSDWGVNLGIGNFNVYNDSSSEYAPFKIKTETFELLTGTGGNQQGLYQDAAGKVGIGTTDPQYTLDVHNGGIVLTRDVNDTLMTGFRFEKDRAGGIVEDNDILGYIRFLGYDGTTQVQSAEIYGYIDGTPGENDMPGKIEFKTTPDGEWSSITRMTIKNDGKVGIGTTSPNYPLQINDTLGTTGISGAGVNVNRSIIYFQSTVGSNGSIRIRADSDNDKMITIHGITGNVGIGVAEPHSKLEVNGSISSATKTINSSSDGVDVAGVNTLFVDTTSAAITIGGLANGVDGQVVHIVTTETTNDMIIEHFEATGTQKINTATGLDRTYPAFGGMTVVCDSIGRWFEVAV